MQVTELLQSARGSATRRQNETARLGHVQFGNSARLCARARERDMDVNIYIYMYPHVQQMYPCHFVHTDGISAALKYGSGAS